MKTIVLRINKDLPNYLSHFTKVGISILLLIICGSAFAQKKYDFQVSIYGTRTPIILIPGYSCSGTVWRETVNHLKDKYECHVLKLPGFAGQAAIKEALLETEYRSTRVCRPQNTSVEEVKKFVDKDALIAQFTSMGDQQLSVNAENITRKLVSDCIKAKTIAEWQIQSD